MRTRSVIVGLSGSVLAVALVGGSAGSSWNVLTQSPATLVSAFAADKMPGGDVLRTPRENWAAIRARVRGNPATQAWVQGRSARMAQWLASYGDNSGWVAGWMHDLVGDDGKPLGWSWTMPEPRGASYADVTRHAAWVAYRRKANIENVQEAARLCRLTGDSRFCVWSGRQLDFYAATYQRWPVATLDGTSRMMGQSLDEAVAAVALADAARLLDRSVSAERRAQWNTGLFAPLLDNLQRSNRGANNIAVWQAAASAILALRLHREADYAAAIGGPGGIRDMLAKGVTPDFLWFEPSNAYGAYTQRALASLFVAAGLAGRGGALRTEMLIAQDMLIAQTTLRYADGTLPVTGDTAPGEQAFDPQLFALTQRVMPIRASAQPLSWDALIDPLTPPAPLPVAASGSRHWPYAQQALLRSGGWEVVFQYGQRTASHAQADALSYQLRYNGQEVTSAPGSAAYGSPLFLEYLRHGVAHTVPLVDGDGQQRFVPGVLLAATATRIGARHSGYGGGADVARTVSLDGNAMTEETRIAVPGGGVHRVGAVFNTPCSVTPTAAMEAGTAPDGLGFSYWRATRVSTATATWSADLGCGGQHFLLAIVADRPGKVFLSQAPDGTGLLTRRALYFETAAPALMLRTRIQHR